MLLAAVFCLLVAAAGWHYMFYSRAAGRLASVEEENANWLRGVLRRIGGAAMLLLAVCFFALCAAVESSAGRAVVLVLGFTVLMLLTVILFLGLLDVRLTWKLRRRGRPDR